MAYTGKDYRAAFTFLEAKPIPVGLPKPLASDLKTLDDAEINLIESGAISIRPPAVGGDATRQEILAQTAYQCRAGVCTPKAQM